MRPVLGTEAVGGGGGMGAVVVADLSACIHNTRRER